MCIYEYLNGFWRNKRMKTEKEIKRKLKELEKDFKINIEDKETMTMIFGELEMARWVLDEQI